jgi:SAM-dependent methyltransferase
VLNSINLLRCSACNFVYADLSEDAIAQYNGHYDDKNVAVYNRFQTTLDDVWFRNITEGFTSTLGAGRVLDIGCGNGRLLHFFKASNWECHGVDLSDWSRPFSEEYGFTLHRGTIEECDLGTTEFDLITSTSTFEHIPRPLEHLQRIMSLLVPGGRAYICGVPNYGSISVRMRFSQFRANTPPAHVNYFTPATVLALIDRLPTRPREISVKTYGIPESHMLYRTLTSRWKRRQRRVGVDNTDKRIATNVNASRLTGLAIRCFYYAGRPFRLGDKLELMLVK